MERDDRACAGGDTELFFRDATVREAKAVCAACPVREECRRDTLGEPYGVFGGRTRQERRRARERVTKAAKTWPEARRIALGRLTYEHYAATRTWTQVQERLGVPAALAKRLAVEYEASLPVRTSRDFAKRVLRPTWPARQGRRDAWAWHEYGVHDAWLKARTADGQHVLAHIDNSRSKTRVWLRPEDVRIYRTDLELPVREMRRGYAYRKAA